jgi:hypothetical protein
MRPNREGKAVVPGRDGYDVKTVEVTGPPTSMAPMPPAKSRGKLAPLGTGEGVPDGVPHRAAPGRGRRRRSEDSPQQQITELRQLVLAVGREVAELRQELERLKSLTDYSDFRTTFEEF